MSNVRDIVGYIILDMHSPDKVEQHLRELESLEKDSVILKELISIIEATAKGEAPSDNENFTVDDYAGGNMDDAYQIGSVDGEIVYARMLLTKINGNQ